MTKEIDLRKMSVLAEKYKGDDLSNIDYEELLELDQQLDLLRIKVEARKAVNSNYLSILHTLVMFLVNLTYVVMF